MQCSVQCWNNCVHLRGLRRTQILVLSSIALLCDTTNICQGSWFALPGRNTACRLPPVACLAASGCG